MYLAKGRGCPPHHVTGMALKGYIEQNRMDRGTGTWPTLDKGKHFTYLPKAGPVSRTSTPGAQARGLSVSEEIYKKQFCSGPNLAGSSTKFPQQSCHGTESPSHMGNSLDVMGRVAPQSTTDKLLWWESRGGVWVRGFHPGASESLGEGHSLGMLDRGWPLSTCICGLAQWISGMLQSMELE